MFGQHSEAVRVCREEMGEGVGRRVRVSSVCWKWEEGREHPLMQYGWLDEEGVKVGACARYGETPWGVAWEVLVNGGAIEASSSSWHLGAWYTSEASQGMYSGWWAQAAFHLAGFTVAEEYLIWLAFGGKRARLGLKLWAQVWANRAKWGLLAWAWDWRDEVEHRLRKLRRAWVSARRNHVRAGGA